MKSALLVGVLGGLLVASVGIAAYAWWSLADVEMSTSGYLALAAGIVLTLVVGIGLMGLVFYSSRRGHDDRAG